MNQDEYNQGYRSGAGSTQDQAAGARDAERDRQRRADEERERWEQAERLRAEQQRDRDASRRAADEQRQRDDRRRAAEQQQQQRAGTGGAANHKRTAAARPARKPDGSSNGADTRSLITVIGFAAGGWLGWSWFPEQWPGVLIIAVIAAALSHALYQWIIAAAVLLVGVWLWSQVESKDTTAADVPVATVEPDAALPALPAAPYAPAPVALPEPEPVSPAVAAAAPSGLFRIDNACPHPMELFVEFEAAGVAPQLLRWEIAGGGRSLIVNDAAGQPITLAHGGLRYQAGLIGRDWYWRGTEPRQFDDRPLAMRDVTLAADAAGDYLLAFECAGYTEPDAGADSAAPFLALPPG